MSSSVRSYRFGDHLKIKRRFYYHHGIYIGDNKVIHYAPPPGKEVADGIGWRQIFGIDSEINTIHITDLKDFELDSDTETTVVKYKEQNAFPPMKIVARADSRLGENGYNLWGNNCEHFVQWCILVHPEQHGNKVWGSVLEGALSSLGKEKKIQAADADSDETSSDKYAEVLSRAKQMRSSYTEFIAHATSLYSNLVTDDRPCPLGTSFIHHDQKEASKDNRNIVFRYEGNLLPKHHSNDWLITDHSIVQASLKKQINFHDVADICSGSGNIIVSGLDGEKIDFPVRYANPDSVAHFLVAAVSGTILEPDAITINLPSRLKQLLRSFLWK